VIRLGAVGDVVRTLPSAAALRAAYPSAHLAWLVEPASASLLEGQPWLDDVLIFPRTVLREAFAHGRWRKGTREGTAFLRRLRAQHFDLVVDFHAILKSGLLARSTAAGRRVSYARPFAREGASWFATEHAHLTPRRQSRFDRNAGLVAYLGIEASAQGPPLRVPPDAAAYVAEALDGGVAPVVMHPGTSDTTAHKRWTAAGYGAVARALRAEGVPVLVTCGPARSDPEVTAAVLAAADGAAQPAPPTTSLLELAALLERARLFVGPDSGPMHVASLVGTPVVQLLGPTDPVENAPYAGTPSRSVRVSIACNPCRRGCAAATCMQMIDSGAVLEAVRALLATSATRPVDCAAPAPPGRGEVGPV
jgi:ADP-heptose:LPS heptosyltransferase